MLWLSLLGLTRAAEAPPSPTIWIEGTAIDTPVGPVVLLPGGAVVFIDGLPFWPPGFVQDGTQGQRVVAKGQLVERFDLPVYEDTPEAENRTGIPVPPGTDLQRARRRFLLIWAEWAEWKITTDPFRGLKPVDIVLSDGDPQIRGAGGDGILGVLHVPWSTGIRRLSGLIKDLNKKGFATIKVDLVTEPGR